MKSFEDPASRGRIDATRREQVLDPERHARERSEFAVAARLVGSVGGRKRILRRLDGVGVQRTRRSDGRVVLLGDLARSEFAGAEAFAKLGDRLGGEIGHSITFGTAKKPCSATGALARISSRQLPSVTMSSRSRSLFGDHGGQRLDAVGVHLAELLDPAEDIVEFGHQPLELLIAHGDAGELGDVPHLFVCD